MTIKECITKYGWQTECNTGSCRAMSVDVDFLNNLKLLNEVQLDINAYDADELSDLFADFCKENNFPTNTVVSITIVDVADTLDEL